MRSQSRVAQDGIRTATAELQQLKSEMGVPRTPEMAELSTLRLEKLYESCSIAGGIEYWYSNDDDSIVWHGKGWTGLL